MRGASLLFLCAVGIVAATDPKYTQGDAVRIFASHVGPLANPSETYPWYVLPFCPPRDGDLEAPQGLSDSLSGDRKSNTPYEFKFKQDEADVVVCERELSEEDVVSAARAGTKSWPVGKSLRSSLFPVVRFFLSLALSGPLFDCDRGGVVRGALRRRFAHVDLCW